MGRPIFWFSKKIDECVEDATDAEAPVKKVVDQELIHLLKSFLLGTICKVKNPTQSNAFPGSQPCSIFAAELEHYREGVSLFTVKSDGLRRKFFSLCLLSDKLLTRPKRDLEEEKRQRQLKLRPLVPECKEQIVNLADMQKKYRTQAKIQEEEEERKRLEAQQALEKTILDKVRKARQEQQQVEDVDVEPELEAEGALDSMGLLDFDLGAAEEAELGASRKRIHSIQTIHGFVTRNWDVYLLAGVGVPEKFMPLVMDGELIRHKPTGQYHYQIFHLDMVNGFPCNDDYSETQRVDLYTRICKELVCRPASVFSAFIAKEKEPWIRFPVVYRAYRESKEYEYEGLITDENQKAVAIGTNKMSKKIKAKGRNTSDLRICRMPQNPAHVALLKLGYLDEKSKKLVLPKNDAGQAKEYIEATQNLLQTFSRMPRGEDFEGRIVECQFVPEENFYYAVKIRDKDDKSVPNVATVVQYTKQNAIENVTPDTLLALWQREKAAGAFDRWRLKPHTQLHRFNGKDYRAYAGNAPANGSFLDKVMKDSNWVAEITPSGPEFQRALKSLNLSWQLDLSLQKEAFQFDRRAQLAAQVAQIEAEHTGLNDFGVLDVAFEDCEYLLDFDKLKALVKTQRKKRRREMQQKRNESAQKRSLKRRKKVRKAAARRRKSKTTS